jgi:hypothetical protein
MVKGFIELSPGIRLYAINGGGEDIELGGPCEVDRM